MKQVALVSPSSTLLIAYITPRAHLELLEVGSRGGKSFCFPISGFLGQFLVFCWENVRN